MTITHISEREAALTRENARLLKTINIQSVTIEAQQEELAKLRAELAALKAQPAQPAPLTDEQASKIARTLADENADACSVGRDDNWKIYGQDFIQDVRFVEKEMAALRTGGAT